MLLGFWHGFTYTAACVCVDADACSVVMSVSVHNATCTERLSTAVVCMPVIIATHMRVVPVSVNTEAEGGDGKVMLRIYMRVAAAATAACARLHIPVSLLALQLLCMVDMLAVTFGFNVQGQLCCCIAEALLMLPLTDMLTAMQQPPCSLLRCHFMHTACGRVRCRS